MEYCEEKAIPHSEFLTRWLPEDRAKVLAVRMERASKCQRCGTSEWEWARDRFAYEPVPIRCTGCHLIDVAREDVKPGDFSTQVILAKPDVAQRLREAPKRVPRRRRE